MKKIPLLLSFIAAIIIVQAQSDVIVTYSKAVYSCQCGKTILETDALKLALNSNATPNYIPSIIIDNKKGSETEIREAVGDLTNAMFYRANVVGFLFSEQEDDCKYDWNDGSRNHRWVKNGTKKFTYDITIQAIKDQIAENRNVDKQKQQANAMALVEKEKAESLKKNLAESTKIWYKQFLTAFGKSKAQILAQYEGKEDVKVESDSTCTVLFIPENEFQRRFIAEDMDTCNQIYLYEFSYGKNSKYGEDGENEKERWSKFLNELGVYNSTKKNWVCKIANRVVYIDLELGNKYLQIGARYKDERAAEKRAAYLRVRLSDAQKAKFIAIMDQAIKNIKSNIIDEYGQPPVAAKKDRNKSDPRYDLSPLTYKTSNGFLSFSFINDPNSLASSGDKIPIVNHIVLTIDEVSDIKLENQKWGNFFEEIGKFDKQLDLWVYSWHGWKVYLSKTPDEHSIRIHLHWDGTKS